MKKCFYCKTEKEQKYGGWVTRDLEIMGEKARVNVSFFKAWICKSCSKKITDKIASIFE